ncbi:hypothetical protein FQN50_006918 [Emmonsiellopsis sp. PD_5]|nr:hypothetical protein FQN50_006918 [Emmonsiellopsis sp. PD_5]
MTKKAWTNHHSTSQPLLDINIKTSLSPGFMAKAKAQKGSGGAAQSHRHLRARIAYLHQASLLLQSASVSAPTKPATSAHVQNSSSSHHIKESSPPCNVPGPATAQENIATPNHQDVPRVPVSKLARQFASQMRGVSRKSQIRLSIDTKRSVCKRCDSLLLPNSTCVETVENASRGGKKPWADVRVVRCNSCGYQKRYPLTMKRGLKLAERRKIAKDQEMADQPPAATNTSTTLPIVSETQPATSNQDDAVITG